MIHYTIRDKAAGIESQPLTKKELLEWLDTEAKGEGIPPTCEVVEHVTMERWSESAIKFHDSLAISV